MEKRFQVAVEKILNSFESVSEWADVIKFLSLLSKTLVQYEAVQRIPCKIVMSKRLAQCLNPALPAGVHSKALEVYAQIFKIIGPGILSQDLHLYAFGLVTLFGQASMSVRPQLISIFKTFLFPLGSHLFPCFKPLIIALLSGLEDESNEYYIQITEMLDTLSSINSRFFYESFWMAVITAPSHRLPAMNYLLKKMPQFSTREEFLMFVGNSTVFTMAVSCALADAHLLTQRTILELLVLRFDLQKQILSAEEINAIMESLLSVMLRKDMSLNRRVYTWILGSAEESTIQEEFLKKNSLEFVCSTLERMLKAEHCEAADLCRPYKILVSLLDKYQLGLPVVERLFFIIIKSLRFHLGRRLITATETELLQTSTMFITMLEPFVIWSQIFNKYSTTELDEDEVQICKFFVEKVRFTDEETTMFHLPAFLIFILHKLNARLSDCMFEIAKTLLEIIPSQFYKRINSSLTNFASGKKLDVRLIEFYQQGVENPQIQSEFVSEFFSFVWIWIINRLRIDCADSYSLLTPLFSFVSAFISNVAELEIEISNDLNDNEWIDALVKCCLGSGNRKEDSIELLLLMLKHEFVSVKRLSDDVIRRLIDVIWEMLDAKNSTVKQLRATKIIWKLHQLTAGNQIVERTIAAYLSKPSQRHFDRFGIFWRLSDSVEESSIQFSRPLFIAINLLASHIPSERRLGETFIRCSLKSLSKLLDPMLCIFLDPCCLRETINDYKLNLTGETMQTQVYLEPFNDAQVLNAFAMLNQIFQYGGLQLINNLHTLQIQQGSTVDKLIQLQSEIFLLKSTSSTNQNHNYLEVILGSSIDFLVTEDQPNKRHVSLLEKIQCNAAEFAHFLIAKSGDVLGLDRMLVIQDCLLRKLLFCIWTGKFDIQTRLISLFHATMSHVSRIGRKSQNQSGQGGHSPVVYGSMDGTGCNNLALINSNKDGSVDSLAIRNRESYPLFVQMILEALSQPANRPLLPYYIDFILSSLPFLKHSVKIILMPIIVGLCDELKGGERRFNNSSLCNEFPIDLDLILFMNALEKIINYCCHEAVWDSQPPIDKRISDASSYGLRGLTDFVTGVFVSTVDHDPSLSSEMKTREILVGQVVELIGILCSLWRLCGESDQELISADDRIRYRIRKLMETFVSNFPMETLEALVDCWLKANPKVSDLTRVLKPGDFTVIAIIESLKNFTSKQIVSTLIELLKDRQQFGNPSRERIRKQLNSNNLLDIQILRFIEFYCGQTIGSATATEVFPMILQMCKDYLLQANASKHLFLSLLLLFNSLIKNISPSFLEEKRTRKETFDVFQKIIDYCILICGRSFDSGLWRKRVDQSGSALSIDSQDTPLTPGSPSGDSIPPSSILPLPQQESDTKDFSALKAERSHELLVKQVTICFSKFIIPSFRDIFSGEQDRVGALFANVVYYILGPNLRSRHQPPYNRLAEYTLEILAESTKIAFIYKVWRKDIWDIFSDPSMFFYMTLSNSRKWRVIVQAILTMEKDRFEEVLSRVNTSQAGIFSSKDQEARNRCLALRKVSFCIFAGDKDQFVPQLPMIQEKLVEMFKQPYNIAHAEIYLCLRVLFFKISSKHLLNFWPVILTELIRLFNQLLKHKVLDMSKGTLDVLLTACKLIDFLLMMGLEQFQLYGWLFVTDSLSALVPMINRIQKDENMVPFAFLDKLAWTALRSTVEPSHSEPAPTSVPEMSGDTDVESDEDDFKDRPELVVDLHVGVDYRRSLFIGSELNYSTITSITQLFPFFEHASTKTMTSVLDTCRNHYNPYPYTAETVIITKEPKSQRSCLNENTIDVDKVSELIELDFLDSHHH